MLEAARLIVAADVEPVVELANETDFVVETATSTTGLDHRCSDKRVLIAENYRR